MSKVTCVKKKPTFKNLTVGKEYDNVIDEGGAFVVTNDIGIRARYAKDYFRVAEEARNIVEAMNLSITIQNGTDIDIVMTGLGRGRRWHHRLSISRALNSCGIQEIEGVSTLVQSLENLRADLPTTQFAGTSDDVITAVLNAVVAYVRANIRCAYLTMSFIVTPELLERPWISALTSSSVFHSTRTNPNTGNVIGLWIIEI